MAWGRPWNVETTRPPNEVRAGLDWAGLAGASGSGLPGLASDECERVWTGRGPWLSFRQTWTTATSACESFSRQIPSDHVGRPLPRQHASPPLPRQHARDQLHGCGRGHLRAHGYGHWVRGYVRFWLRGCPQPRCCPWDTWLTAQTTRRCCGHRDVSSA